MYPIETKLRNKTIYKLAFVYMTATFLHVLTAAAFAATDVESTYIDSVYSWGIWELGLEPASGPQVSANNAINDRSRRLQFRPNDNAAYITQSIAVPPISTITPPPPAPTPIVGASGSGPILPGMVPNSPNLR